MSTNYKPRGYHRLAQLQGRSDDVAILRRFDDLNMLILMSLQAEIIEMHDEFFAICEDDYDEGKGYEQSFEKLFNSKNSPNNFQYMKLLEIRQKMKEYNDRILQVANVHRLESPSKHNLKHLQEWLRDTKGANSLLHKDRFFAWSEPNPKDFLTFRVPHPDEDYFTNWLTSWPTALYHRLWGRKHTRTGGRKVDEETGLVSYHEGRLNRTTKIFSTVFASTMPMITILGLYFEKDLLKRIYIAIGITAAFALILSVFTNARRIEIFAATASLAAVEVVFIGNTDYD